ncbi:uncharacterized protein EV420DRAFT_1769796 [Desarmillaria tabescens]|uniref:NACHT domain-containing protein n=1 Tax=Armillaria tabescens TaxID=1929756 RepID=A0AA39JCK0_ARMTA|nr:uncharacterized protein EV420DRAFT_1769796 [Desarmillaria tabescens]KAK0438163.1 hypothetical protein EV420DRAFT_1769796 [Desarmillaria tabescens]
MVEALGTASSVGPLIQKSRTITTYLKNIKEAPKELDKLLKELRDLEIALTMVELHTRSVTEDDLWLVTLQELETTLDELTEILNKLKKRLEDTSSWMRRMLQWPFTKDGMEEDLGKLERIKSLLLVAAQHNHLALSRAVQRSREVLETTYLTNQLQMDREAAYVAAWLTPLDYNCVQHDKLEQRASDTGAWFFKSPQFLSWTDISKAPSTLWCFGDPGVGKTIFASVIVDHLRVKFNAEETLVLCTFCDYRSAATQTVTNVICSLLKQFIQARLSLTDSIKSFYNRYSRNGTRPSLDGITNLLSQELEPFRHVYIILDALDEFNKNLGGRKELIDILRALGDNICLLVTSRNIHTIRSLFVADTKLDIRADGADIRKTILVKLKQGYLPISLKGGKNIREKILKTVVEKADGVQVSYACSSSISRQFPQITNGLSRSWILKLPNTIEHAYEYLLTKIDSQPNKDLAYRIFGWIAFAERPLTGSELQHALAVEPRSKSLSARNIVSYNIITKVCAGFVVRDRQGSPSFVHHSMQEFFISRKAKLFPYIQEDITRTCLAYMSLDIFSSPDSFMLELFCNSLEVYPFLRYSSNNWTYHARKCTRDTVENEILTFLPTRAKVALSFEEPPYSQPEVQRTPAWFAARYGLVHVMEAGQLAFVELLLSRDDWDVDVNRAGKIMLPHSFAEIGHQFRGFGLEDIFVCSPLCTPLIAAASNGHERTVERLLQSSKMETLNASSSSGMTALSTAISDEHVGVVKLLLSQPDTDTSITYNNLGLDALTPIMLAAGIGNEDILRILLERGDDPDAATPKGIMALHCASMYGHSRIVEILLMTGRVDINAVDHLGYTALMKAAIGTSRMAMQTVKVLSEHTGIDIMAKNVNGRSAYSLAVGAGHGKIVTYLASKRHTRSTDADLSTL